ncbi:E3 ubiquitin-protein ligase CBL-C isoform X2 [Phycodurus eques]|uniref:E3 ubiquitin-protein ligase CBL-C isoform X2 n=1 Tax=Phycodurus eques TaxID=693459 RepID=UPI002ACEFAAB|nr:E3 ubiquitin-protein ligase CBL-C isoform X2 [Phycodurus eques]
MATASSEDNVRQHPTNGDHMLVNKTLRRLEKLHELCSDPRLSLKNSPPYLPELVPNTASVLRRVWKPYRGLGALMGRAPAGDEAVYLRVHARNLLDKTDRALLLFKDKDKMFDETSSYRMNLTKLSLIFSHMLWELKAVFPGERYHGDTYKMIKTEARDFWKLSFGKKCIVRWSSFAEKLRRVHLFEDGMESMALKSTVDLTCNDHVSVFEFDIFTRLFQPWGSLLWNWNQLAVTHPGYMAFLTYDQAVSRLKRYIHKPGSYIFRLSCTRMGQWAIGYVTGEGGIVQTIPENMSLCLALLLGHSQECYLYPDGRDVNPDLTALHRPEHKAKVNVTREQYELYCDPGTSFQLCKICTEKDKDTRIEPCGHLMCRRCLDNWLKSAGHTCPYCRSDIDDTEPVDVEPYQLEHKEEEESDDDEDDHEDIELVVKQMGALRKTVRSYSIVFIEKHDNIQIYISIRKKRCGLRFQHKLIIKYEPIFI